MSWWTNPYLITSAIMTTTAVSVTCAWGTFSPQSRLWGSNIAHGPATSPPRVALSFDDGPSAMVTPQILQILAEFNVPAAFFVVGTKAQAHPDLVRQAYAQGHLIGNHTFDHAGGAILRGAGYWRAQLRRNDEVVQALIGQRPGLFRPPYGFKTWPVMRAVRANGQTLVSWSRRGMDGVATTPQRILQRLVPQAGAGDILNLHDSVEPGQGHPPNATVAALPKLITGLRQRGLQIVRLDQLLGIAAYVV